MPKETCFIWGVWSPQAEAYIQKTLAPALEKRDILVLVGDDPGIARSLVLALKDHHIGSAVPAEDALHRMKNGPELPAEDYLFRDRLLITLSDFCIWMVSAQDSYGSALAEYARRQGREVRAIENGRVKALRPYPPSKQLALF